MLDVQVKKIKRPLLLAKWITLTYAMLKGLAINKKFILAANDIFKFVRNGDIVKLAKLNDMDAEMVVIVNENSKVLIKK